MTKSTFLGALHLPGAARPHFTGGETEAGKGEVCKHSLSVHPLGPARQGWLHAYTRDGRAVKW